MARVKDYLSQITKELEKNSLNTEEKLVRIKEELASLNDFKLPKEYGNLKTEREKELLRALKYLEEKLETEKETKEEKQEKDLSKRAYKFFVKDVESYIKSDTNLYQFFQIAKMQEQINYENQVVNEYLKVYDLDFRTEYLKAVQYLEKIYKSGIDKSSKKNKEKKWYSSLIGAGAILGILKICDDYGKKGLR